MEVFKVWGITNKVWMLLTDGAAPMLKSSRDLNKLYQSMRDDESMEADNLAVTDDGAAPIQKSPRDLNKLYLSMREEDESLEADSSDEEEIGDFDEVKEALDEALLLQDVYYDHREASSGMNVTRLPCSAHKVSTLFILYKGCLKKWRHFL